MTGYKQNVRKYLRSKMGRYVDLRYLPSVELAGVVVHDDACVFDRAFAKTAYPNQGKNKFSLLAMDIGGRFSARVVLYGGKCVLLIGTGMGCAGTSIVAHELSFLLGRSKVRIIKVGTCVSTHPAYPVKTVLVPRWAIADEGTTAWDGCVSGRCLSPRRFEGKAVVAADNDLTRAWRSHLIRKWSHPGASPPDGKRDTAIWSADAFYPLMVRPGFFRAVSRGHEIEYANACAPRTVVSQIRRSKQTSPGGDAWIPLAAWDMECAALFSAGEAHDLEVTAALVVSWSAGHWTQIASCGHTSRHRWTGMKKTVHDIEDSLVVEAVVFLCGSRAGPSITPVSHAPYAPP